eukprot:829589-Pelagomonas_calceolata.AAC.2
MYKQQAARTTVFTNSRFHVHAFANQRTQSKVWKRGHCSPRRPTRGVRTLPRAQPRSLAWWAR